MKNWVAALNRNARAPAIASLIAIPLLVLPALLPFVRRAGPPLLILLAIVAIVSRVRNKDAKQDILAGVFTSRAVQACMALLVWGAVTLVWSALPLRGALQLGAAGVAFISGFILIFAAQLENDDAHGAMRHKTYALCLATGSAVVIVDMLSGLPVASLVRNNDEAHRYNMIVVSLLVLCWGLSARQDVSRIWLWLAWIGVATATFVSESESAKLALLVSGGARAFAAIAPRRALTLVIGLGILFCWASAPWIGTLIDAGIGLASALPEAAHAQDRVIIWRGSGAAALAFMPWGAGAGASLALAQDAVRLVQFHGLGWGHTHNNFLQVWLELGIPGMLLGAVASLAIWRTSASLSVEPFRRACGLAAAVCVIALVSHGLWQTWFWASVFVAVTASRHTSQAHA